MKETDMICPECGEKIFKHYHVHHDIHFPEYRWFWCRNFCDIDCRNCMYSFRDECTAFFCMNMSGWKPIKLHPILDHYDVETNRKLGKKLFKMDDKK